MPRRCCTLAMLALLPVAFPTLAAQRTSARSGQALRAEYAAVLLQSGRYSEAAQEYRTLLTASPRQPEYRLGLARALAWGGHPRDAERELHALSVLRPSDAAVSALLSTTRASYDPSVREAEQWLADAPTFAPYRLALARALVRDGAARAALPHYDLLLVLGRPIEARPIVTPSVLLRESAEARVAAGDRAEGVRRLRDALARSPGDTTIRHGLAVVQAAGGDPGSALAQYDTLLAPRDGRIDSTGASLAASTPGERAMRASLLLERAQVNVTRGDLAAAEIDASASLAMKPGTGAHLLLGDLSRWRGQYAAARASYARARALQPGSPAIASAFARLARDEHPALAFAPMESGEDGWRADGTAVGDNLGVRYFTAGVRRGIALPGGIAASIGVNYRQLSRADSRGSTALPGYAAEMLLSRDGQIGALYTRVGGHGGLVSQPGLGIFPEGSLSVASWYGAWGIGVDLRSALAYPSLLTIGALSPSQATTSLAGGPSPVDRPLRAQTVTGSIAGPVARADLALVGQRSQLSDGNVRSTLQLFARLPVAPRLSMIYAGSGMRYASRSTLYWDPVGYVSNATGLEYAVRRVRGFSFALQALPGVAWSNELPGALGAQLRRTAVQFTGGGDASYHTELWDAGGAVTYSRARAGDYQQLGASVLLRLHP